MATLKFFGASRSVQEPEVELLAAAPITAYTAPLDAAGRRGIAALTLVAVAGLAVTLVLTRRVTRSLVRLAVAADAVTRGDLSPRVEQGSEDEVVRVARAFNGMIESLRRMLRERSEREAVAAVGEFAASLAHEIRNPLSTVRLNLQHLQEQLPADAGGQEAARRALADIDRLDRTVGGVLRMARLRTAPTHPQAHSGVPVCLPAASPLHLGHFVSVSPRHLSKLSATRRSGTAPESGRFV